MSQNILKWSLLVLLSVASKEMVYSVEIRTYQFESGSYSSSCGECSRWYNVHGGIEGSFSVAIDYPNKRGTLLDLDAQITEIYELIGKIIEVDGVRQFSIETIPIPLESYGTELSIDWVIGSGWEGFLSVDEDSLVLTSSPPNNEGENNGFIFQDEYKIVMGQDDATLSISSQAIDLSFGIVISEATRVIPEPSTFTLVAIVLPVTVLRRKTIARYNPTII